MSGRTLFPRINDTYSEWLSRLIHGTRWENEEVPILCYANGHTFTTTRRVAPNDATASNMVTLTFYSQQWRCPECGSDLCGPAAR